MTTIFHLLRHAAHDNVGGFLAGRMDGIALGAAGLAQARRLAERLTGEALAAIISSPRQRTAETAVALAALQPSASMAFDPSLDEINFGEEWQGRDFDSLNTDPDWQRWNAVRSLSRTPGGETMRDVAVRAMGLIERIGASHAGRTVALVTHADVIRAIVCDILGLGIDAWPRFDIAPASISTIAYGRWGARLLRLNAETS